MTISNLIRTILLGMTVFAFSATLAAQELQDQRKPAEPPADFRTNALRQLGLSREQLQRIRRLNMERKPLMDAAQMRLRQANRALDDAIYSDTATEADVQARLRDFQFAQGEVIRIRFMNEYGVRRILTPEQLTRFRILRQRFEQAKGNGPERRAALDATMPEPVNERSARPGIVDVRNP